MATCPAECPTTVEPADVGKDYSCSAEEVADAKLTTRRETLLIIESLTQDFLQAIANGEDPELYLVTWSMLIKVVICNSLSLSLSLPPTGHTF